MRWDWNRLDKVRASQPLVVSSDDLGMTFGFNEGIREASKYGVLTSTCLSPSGPAYRHAVNHVLPDCPGLAVGVHVDLQEGGPVSRLEHVSRLVGRDGRFCHGYAKLMRLSYDPAFRAQVRREWIAQVERVLKDGVKIDHLNSHRHVHMIPRLFEVLCEVAREHGVTWIRNVREPYHLQSRWPHKAHPWTNSNIIKHFLLKRFAAVNRRIAARHGLRSNDWMVGTLYTGRMTEVRIAAGLSRCGGGVVELLVHTARANDPRDHDYCTPSYARYANSHWRELELAAIRSHSFKVWLSAQGWRPCSYGQAGRAVGLPVQQAEVCWPDLPATPISTI